ncbi:MAG: carbonic anhydrase [Bacteroidetes bacterium]|nr:carbonic anhydrase [Bacteroidota bacterium]
MTTHNKESLQRLTPAEALAILVKGNERFVNNLKTNRNLLQQMNETKEGQHPFAVILSCMDSRTSAELIFDQGLGDIFSIRIAGNFVSNNILGSIEYAAGVAGVKLILVLGHTGCGAIQGAVDGVRLGHLTDTLRNLKPALDHTPREDASGRPYTHRVAETNVRIAIEDILRKSDVVRDLLGKGDIAIAGGMYDVGSGLVDFIHASEQLETRMEGVASTR